MLKDYQLLEAMSGVREEDILAVGQAMGYLPGTARRKKNFWRPVLLAAVLTALLAATAVAATLLGRAQRMAPMPTDPSGAVRQAEIPNGFRGTPTYQGSSEWWAYMARWEDAHGTEPADYSLDFIEGDLDRYLVCSLYGAYDEAQAKKLYEIAEDYDLKLYREMLYFWRDDQEFYELTGVQPFLPQRELRAENGYVLEDGSFRISLQISLEKRFRWMDVHRCYSGSIYPEGGAAVPRAYEESEYTTGNGDRVFIDIFGPGQGEITYMDPRGETYITLKPFLELQENPLEICRKIADLVDFEALCIRDVTKVRAILDQPTGAEENPESVRKLLQFQDSPAFRGVQEFGSFYGENFYGPCFTGTWGMEGLSDLDGELERISRKYDLQYARERTVSGGRNRRSIAFDNGAWQKPVSRSGWLLHYIPKTALYTMLPRIPDVRSYRRIWPYETEDGVELVLFTQGPGGRGGGYGFYETEDAYLLLNLHCGSPRAMETAAESVDWREVLKTGG